ncbi:NlpC/P60 family protein [Aureibaculum sp. 2210JD6-5]|uniref:C40 family peptidase n=1 Tax=Aureibaculum sp. 2210JD6-5 TaxID=3103957 RepID=UPI002AADF53C|nr:NlpC/P60 family protein [Aureibaculum sp. 2210JD6-5]MDY7394243.1 NlpC/P60 family protein [Aureibaculum sp. 2210JD6-5]
MIHSKFLYFFLIILLLTSCGASKKAAAVAKVESELEKQYQLYEGVPYKYGGTDRRGFDCSGFVRKVYKDGLRTQLPRTTKEIATMGRKVSKHRLKPGDLVFFRPSRKYRHVGIYVGDNLFMHSSTSKGIMKSNLDNSYWKKKFRYAKSILIY